MDKPTTQVWIGAKRILRYLQGSKDMGITFRCDKSLDISLKAFSDSDWASDRLDRKSVSGSIILHGKNPVVWFSKKQGCVALSTAEAESVAAAACAQDLVNLRGMLEEFELNTNSVLYCDNRSTVSIIKTNENSKRVKHIDIRNHFIKDLVISKIISVDYVPTEENLADILTKPLCKTTFEYLRAKFVS